MVSSVASKEALANSYIGSTGNVGLGLVRGYLTSIGAVRQIVSNAHLSELHSVFANRGSIPRLFCSGAPKRRSE